MIRSGPTAAACGPWPGQQCVISPTDLCRLAGAGVLRGEPHAARESTSRPTLTNDSHGLRKSHERRHAMAVANLRSDLIGGIYAISLPILTMYMASTSICKY